MENKQDIRSNTTESIYWFLKEQQSQFDALGIITLCDELLLRNQPIKYLNERFENKLKRLSSKQLKWIERKPELYSPATMKVVDVEVSRRKLETAQWFYSANFQDTEGPYTRAQIVRYLEEGKIFDDYAIWKEGTKDWIKISSLSWLKRDFYFDQELPEEEFSQNQSDFSNKSRKSPPPPPGSNQLNDAGSGNRVALGVLSFVSMPFWIGAIVYSFFLSDTELGIMIPLMFSLFAFGASIPVGVGLLMKRKWAWSMNLFVTGGAVCLVILNSVFYDFNVVWMFFGLLCTASVFLLMDGRESYQ